MTFVQPNLADYPLDMKVIDARQLYFESIGVEGGGYNEKWVKLKVGPIPIAFPNTKARRKAVPRHDTTYTML